VSCAYPRRSNSGRTNDESVRWSLTWREARCARSVARRGQGSGCRGRAGHRIVIDAGPGGRIGLVDAAAHGGPDYLPDCGVQLRLGTLGVILWLTIAILGGFSEPGHGGALYFFFAYFSIGLLVCPAITFSANYVTRWIGPRMLRLLVIPPFCIAGVLALLLLLSEVLPARR